MMGITGVSTTSLELVGAIVVLAAVAAVADIVTKPGWAWKASGHRRTAAVALAVLVPVVGPALYATRLRPEVVAVAASGRAATLPFEGRLPVEVATTEAAVPSGFGSFGEQRPPGQVVVPTLRTGTTAGGPPPAAAYGGDGGDGGPDTFFSTRSSGRRPSGLATRTYRPRQRESFAEAVAPVLEEAAVRPAATAATSAVPAGWKADPTGRHEYRYWDGTRWTENVATGGIQSLDAAAS